MTALATRLDARRGALAKALLRVGKLSPLAVSDLELMASLLGPVAIAVPGSDLVDAAGRAQRPGLIVSGWACRQRLLPDGRRQIFDLLMPGDFVGLNRSKPLDAAWTVCLTRVELADADRLQTYVMGAAPEHSAPRQVFEILGSLEENRLLDHVVRLGRQTAYERVAHLCVELHRRAQAVGDAESRRFPLPLTQEILADTVGLSVVHVNRVLQQLRRERLIDWRGGVMTLLDPDHLAQICDFGS